MYRHRTNTFRLLALGALALAAAQPAAAQDWRWSLLRGPDAIYTYGQDVNNAGTIVGFYASPTGSVNFIKKSSGDFVPFDIPGAEGLTFFSGINSSGTATGTWYTPDFKASVFVRNADGSYRALSRINDMDTSASRITDNGQIVGNVSAFDPVTFQTLVQRGALIDTLHGDAVTYVDYPGLPFTYLMAGNNHGMFAGWAASADFSTFLWFTAKNGVYSPFSFPAGSLFGNLFDVNNRDEVLGVYVSPDFVVHGFIQGANGKFVSLDYPGLAGFIGSELPPTLDFGGGFVYTRVDSATLTLPFGFNDRDDLVGALGVGYADPSGQVQFWLFAPDGFVATRGSRIK